MKKQIHVQEGKTKHLVHLKVGLNNKKIRRLKKQSSSIRAHGYQFTDLKEAAHLLFSAPLPTGDTKTETSTFQQQHNIT